MDVTPSLLVPRLGRKKLAALTDKARRFGMTPRRYLQHLIDEDLARDQEARETSFAEIMGGSQPVDDREIDRLIDEARTRYHRAAVRKA